MDKSRATWKGKGIAECSSRPYSHSTRGKHHRIPGPAGVVQEALERRARGEAPLELNTQQVVHRALTVEAEDTEFTENPAWLNAVEFGYLDMDGYTDLATVNQLACGTRVDLVVALVKSVERISPESSKLILKDPTSSVVASIHDKAHADGKFAGKIDSGVCLVLTNVVIFRAWRSSPTALNIVRQNIEYVIRKQEPEVDISKP